MKIKHVSWRNGRPRFNPPANLRKHGHKGHDLKLDGRFMTRGEATDWSDNFEAKLKADRAKTLAARKRAAIEVEKLRLAAADLVPKAPRTSRSLTLGQLLEHYFASGPDIRPMTLQRYRSCARVFEHEAPMAWATEAAAVRRNNVVRIYGDLKDKRGPIMAFGAIRLLGRVYNWAIDRGELVTDNPAYRIKMARPKPRVKALGIEQYLHLVATADALGYGDIGDMIAWAVFTAQRVGDRIRIAKADIVDGRVTVEQQKTGAIVVVKLAKPIVERMKKRPGHDAPTVLAHEGLGKPFVYQTYGKRWRQVRTEAARTMPSVAGFNDQDFRDTAITWMLRAGCTETQVMSVSGHDYGGKTSILSHYADIDYTLADEAIAKLERWYAKELKKLKQEK